MATGNILGQRLAQGIKGDFTGKSIGAYLVSTDANGTMQWESPSAFTEKIQDSIGSFITSGTRIVSSYDDTGNSLSFDIATNSIDATRLAQMPALTIKGNPSNALAPQADIAFNADFTLLMRNGNALTTALISGNNIANSAIGLSKFANIASNTVLANLSAGNAAPTATPISALKSALVDIPVIVTGVTQVVSPGTTYIANNAAEIVFSLPLTSSIGDYFEIIGYGLGGYRVNQTVAAQFQVFTGISTTPGITSGAVGTIRSGVGEHFASAYWVCVSASPITWLCVPGVGTSWRIDE